MTHDDKQSPPQIVPLGQDGILVRFGEGYRAAPRDAQAFGDKVRRADLTGVTEVATSLASTLIRFGPDVVTRADLTAVLLGLLDNDDTKGAPPATRLWTIPACFGGDAGPQLAEAADLAGLSVAEAITALTGTEVNVLAIGFAPGQPYLGLLPKAWDMPRQRELTPQVPAGALVVALRQLVLFANPSPTGWRWIGSCAFAPFRADRAEPFALRAGDRIRFAQTDAARIAALRDDADGLGGAVCEVTA
ncbi:MAG: allophanate hydrolase subunit 1 [Alphaproteobacteria bacterium]|nr:allophanate hydrolase subunit 1 [Alphaproteobacteria bacterium]